MQKSRKSKSDGRYPLKFWITLFALGCSVLTMGCLLSQCSGGAPPPIVDGEAFEPDRDVSIEGGEYHIPSLDITEDVNVAFDEDVHLIVDGDATINGTLSAGCANLTMDVGGAFDISGSLNSECEGEDESANVTLNLPADAPISFGGADAAIDLEGELIVNVGDVQSEKIPPPLPFTPVEDPLPPICSLTTNSLVYEMNDEGIATIPLIGECLDPNEDAIETLELTYLKYKTSNDSIAMPEKASELFEMGETSIKLDEPGHYMIHLAAEDEDGQESEPVGFTVYIIDPELEQQPDHLGLGIELPDLFYEVGDQLTLSAVTENIQSEPGDILYDWRFLEEDDTWTSYYSEWFSGEKELTIDLDETGILNILLHTLIGEDDSPSFAVVSIYVYEPQEEDSFAGVLGKPVPVGDEDFYENPIVIKAGAKPYIVNRIEFRVLPVTTRPVWLKANVTIIARDGVTKAPKVGKGYVHGADGDDGGGILIYNLNGSIALSSGVTLQAGSGANGQDAVATATGPGRKAEAVGGIGGKPGRIWIGAYTGFYVYIKDDPAGKIPEVTLILGKGGDGGNATATGGDGAIDCNNPTNGGRAVALGGLGRSASRVVWFSKTIYDAAGQVIILKAPGGGMAGALGGKGGDAEAIGGNGGNAANPAGGDCFSCKTGGKGGSAWAVAGKGGNAALNPNLNRVNYAGFPGGDGGDAWAVGGWGGDGSDCDQANEGAAGGHGGAAEARFGRGGKNYDSSFTPRLHGADGMYLGGGGDGGDGGDGLLLGGPGGKGGNGNPPYYSGIPLPDGADGLPGGVIPGLAAKIKLIKINLVDPVMKFIELAIEFDVEQGAPPAVNQVAAQLQDQFLILDVDENAFVSNDTLEVTLYFDEQLAEDMMSVWVIDEDGNWSEEFAVEVILPEADGGTPPVITAVEFPEGNVMDPIANDRIEISSDGTPIDGWIHFTDAEGDMAFAQFEPMEVDSAFDGFEFTVEEYFLEGDFFEGRFEFNLWCGEDRAGEQITLRIMLQDAAGNWSEAAILALYCD